MNIELHIERVQSILDQMDLQKKCKFAARSGRLHGAGAPAIPGNLVSVGFG